MSRQMLPYWSTLGWKQGVRKVTSAPRMGSWVETIHTKKGYKPQKAVNVTNNVTKRDQQRDQVYMFDLFIFRFEEINMFVY